MNELTTEIKLEDKNKMEQLNKFIELAEEGYFLVV